MRKYMIGHNADGWMEWKDWEAKEIRGKERHQPQVGDIVYAMMKKSGKRAIFTVSSVRADQELGTFLAVVSFVQYG